MSKLYGTKEAAEKLGVSQARIRQYIQEERLSSTKVGRDHLIEDVVLEEFAEYGRKKPGRPKKDCTREIESR